MRRAWRIVWPPLMLASAYALHWLIKPVAQPDEQGRARIHPQFAGELVRPPLHIGDLRATDAEAVAGARAADEN